MMIELHRKLLGDKIRNDAFAQALKKVIIPGKTAVLDLGSGTGYLSFLAARLGARRCWLIDSSPGAVKLSRKLARLNGIQDCEFIAAHSTDVRERLKADVIVSETLGSYALEENILESLEDAKRFLAPGGVLLPHGLTQFIAPLTDARCFHEVNVFEGLGFDFSPAREMALNNMYVKVISPSALLSPTAAQTWDTIDFRKKNSSIRTGKCTWDIQKPTRVYGFALWWKIDLVDGITLSTGPSDPATHWEQLYLPVLKPVELSADDMLVIELKSDTRFTVGVNVGWNVFVTSRDGKKKTEMSLNMSRGQLD